MLTNLAGKKIILGVTGGVAAYKAAELVRILVTAKAEVQIIMTKAAEEFVRPLTFATLSQHTVHTEMFQQNLTPSIEHIALARWADAILIAPCSANTIAKLEHGIADNLLTTVCLAAAAPICVAPAMNQEMWRNGTTAANVKSLAKRGVKFLGPAIGELACGETGCGKMIAPSEIAALLANVFVPSLFKNKKIVVTAGPTIEPIDPIRYISNHSSGQMGYAIARAAADYGAAVILISGPTNIAPPHHVKCINVASCEQMFAAVMSNIDSCDIFIAAAAVADYRVKCVAPQKIKKDHTNLELKLVKNPDILARVAALKKPPFTVGFAAETENLIANAKDKLKNKNIDLIVANLVGEGVGFNVLDNALTLITKNGVVKELAFKSKDLLAYELLEAVFKSFA